ncbi:MAG: DNA translocase FtsK 4TM domain-containing protein [Deltaproteobacteria bacterium]|nr:MAG: DNA translocase FtsK 4TM domain-containing protein [Deltaproteobacteria bacterium]
MAKASSDYPIKREIWGVVFLLLTLVVAVSLVSYNPQDPLFWEKAGALDHTENLFGPIGSHLAGCLFLLLGLSSFWLIAILLYLAICFFRGRFPSGPIWMSVSLVLLVLSFSALVSLYKPDGMPYRGALVSGGLAGLHCAGLGKKIFNFFGAYTLFLAIFVISFMFITRFSFGKLFDAIWEVISTITVHAKETWVKFTERRKRAKTRKTVAKKVTKGRERKLTIVEPPSQKLSKPTQEFFPFMSVPGKFKLPPLELLDETPKPSDTEVEKESLRMNALRLEGKLRDFGVEGEVVEIVPGPVITMYEFKPAPGVKISKVASLADDLALNLRASNIRIVAPIPGKSAIGIEIPNNKRRLVTLKEILSSQIFQDSPYRLTIALGMDIIGQPVITDLTRMPHLLVAGATGTGKSVSINAMINSVLFKSPPEMVRFVMVDPKRIELSPYQDIPHLLHPVVNNPKEATNALRWAVDEMERRYTLLSDKGVRNIEAYNRKIKKERGPVEPDMDKKTREHLPYIIIIIDELADLMMVSSREVEESLARLAQMARAAGIHLIIATQRPSVDVLTGIIKANFPTRISFQVSSRVDSRTILDTMGAEQLLGDGDMLFLPPGVAKLTRIHGAYVSEDEVKRVTSFLREQMKPDYDTSIVTDISAEEEIEELGGEKDEKYQDAVALVYQTGQASISMVQRKLRVGYNRAARMIEAMEKEGIVGPSDGSRPREVFTRRERF